jgi:hypothetical protein
VSVRLSATLAATAWALTLCTLTGCNDDPGPLELSGPSFMADYANDDVWFNVRGCAEPQDEKYDVAITKATVTGVSGATPDEVEVYVSWGGAPGDAMVGPGDLLNSYRVELETPAGAEGAVQGCSLSFAVVLPRPEGEMVRVRGIDVTYETRGETYTSHAPLELAACPSGTRAGSTTCIDTSDTGGPS